MRSPFIVRDALFDLLKTVQAPTFTNSVKLANMRKGYDATFLADARDVAYPKVLLIMSGGSDERLPGMSRQRKLTFLLLIIVKQLQTGASVEDQEATWLKDLTQLIFDNGTLGGVVQSVDVTDFMLSGGALRPEGAVSLRLETDGYEYDQ